jgi:hypothetical protein
MRMRTKGIINTSTDVSGQTIGPIFKGQMSSWTPRPLKVGPIGCPETSITNYQPTPCNISEEQTSQLHDLYFLPRCYVGNKIEMG